MYVCTVCMHDVCMLFSNTGMYYVYFRTIITHTYEPSIPLCKSWSVDRWCVCQENFQPIQLFREPHLAPKPRAALVTETRPVQNNAEKHTIPRTHALLCQVAEKIRIHLFFKHFLLVTHCRRYLVEPLRMDNHVCVGGDRTWGTRTTTEMNARIENAEETHGTQTEGAYSICNIVTQVKTRIEDVFCPRVGVVDLIWQWCLVVSSLHRQPML